MPSIHGLVGVLVWTSADRYPPMRRFYVDTLGLTPRSDRRGFVNFAWDGVRLTVAVHSEVAGPAVEPERIMVNLGVTDIHTDVAELERSGVDVVRHPEQESWGGWVATVRDPDGNLIQLLQLP